ncbi:MAG: hypothetical protein AMXMBFR37_23390 [Steroidobacteraceae bacterium]
MKNLILGAAAIAAFACSATVFADFGDNVTVHKVYVHYSDLNANSAQGAEALYARLKSAAKTACGGEPGRGLDAFADFRQCRSDALSQAVADVGSRTLTALHRTHLPPLELARFDGLVSVR